MSYPEKLLASLQGEIEKLTFPDTPRELYEPLRYTLALDGKRIRPLLTLMAADLFGGRNDDSMKAALAVELFHNFTLIHDDIMDDAPVRRGKPSVHKKWNRDVAILSGDAMLIKAYECLSGCNAALIPESLRLFNNTAFKVCEGQQLDMNFENTGRVTIPEYLDMITLKTAVLLGAALQLGALSAGALNEDAQLLYEFGKNTGVAFQLKDDWLDVYADPDKFGKRTGGDIIAGKKTYLLVRAMEQADSKQAKELESLFSREASLPGEEKITRVKKIYDTLGLSEQLSEEMQKHFRQGVASLDQVKVKKERKSDLHVLAELLMSREM